MGEGLVEGSAVGQPGEWVDAGGGGPQDHGAGDGDQGQHHGLQAGDGGQGQSVEREGCAGGGDGDEHVGGGDVAVGEEGGDDPDEGADGCGQHGGVVVWAQRGDGGDEAAASGDEGVQCPFGPAMTPAQQGHGNSLRH